MTGEVVRKNQAWARCLCGRAPSCEEVSVLQEVLHAVRSIRHGHVQVIIQDARVVQIDRTEKVRLERQGEKR